MCTIRGNFLLPAYDTSSKTGFLPRIFVLILIFFPPLLDRLTPIKFANILTFLFCACVSRVIFAVNRLLRGKKNEIDPRELNEFAYLQRGKNSHVFARENGTSGYLFSSFNAN